MAFLPTRKTVVAVQMRLAAMVRAKRLLRRLAR
jgi:hypothetical protein